MTSEKTPTGDGDKTSRPKRLAWLWWPVNRWKQVAYGRRVAICAALYLVVAFVTVLNAPRWLLGEWLPNANAEDRGKLLGTAGNLVLLALGGVIAVVTVGLSLARHRQEVEAADRDLQRLTLDQGREQARIDEVKNQRTAETERALRERFVTTVKLLSDPAPVNRQAALYALGALADDWDAFKRPDEVRVCIEVLTGYLRAPRSDDMLAALEPEEALSIDSEDYYVAQRTTPQEIAVRQAGFTVIRNHLQDDRSPHWRDRYINLSQAHIDFPVGLLGCAIQGDGLLDFRDAHIAYDGTVDLADASVRGKGRIVFTHAIVRDNAVVDLTRSTISNYGTVDCRNLIVSGGKLIMINASVTNFGRVSLRNASLRYKGEARLSSLSVNDGGVLDFTELEVDRGGKAKLLKLSVGDTGTVDIVNALVEGEGILTLRGAPVDAGGRVNFNGTTASGKGRIDFTNSTISAGGEMNVDDNSIQLGGVVLRPNGIPRPAAL